jgi:hypothetical protein
MASISSMIVELVGSVSNHDKNIKNIEKYEYQRSRVRSFPRPLWKAKQLALRENIMARRQLTFPMDP